MSAGASAAGPGCAAHGQGCALGACSEVHRKRKARPGGAGAGLGCCADAVGYAAECSVCVAEASGSRGGVAPKADSSAVM